jgi:hypothetical protein
MIFISVGQSWIKIYDSERKTPAKYFTNDLQARFNAYYNHSDNFTSHIEFKTKIVI